MAKAVMDAVEESEAQQLDKSDPFKHLKKRKVSPSEWWDIIRSIPETAWGRYRVYGYRLWPKIDRKLSNPSNPNNIFIAESVIDEDWVTKNHGSGTYHLNLTDGARPDKFRTVCEAVVKINNDEFPPVLDIRELDMGYDGNRSYVEGLRARGLLKDTDGHTANPDQMMMREYIEHLKSEVRDKKQDSPEVAAINKAISILSAAYTQGLETLGKQSPSGSLKEAVDGIKGIVELTRPTNPPNPIEMVKEIAKLLQPQGQPNGVSSFKEMASAFKDIATVVRPETPPANTVDQTILSKFMERALEKVWGDEGGGPSGLGGKWDFWGEVIRQGAPALRDIVHDAIGAWQLAKLGGAWTPSTTTVGMAGTPRGGGPTAGPAFAAALPGPTPRGDQPQAPQPGPGPSHQPATPTQSQPDPRMQVLAQVAPGFLNHLTSGSSGDAFAQWVETGYGALAYDQLASFGVEGLLDVLKTSPFWSQLAPLESRVREFLTDFIDYGKDDGEDEHPEAEEPPAVVETGKAKGGRK